MKILIVTGIYPPEIGGPAEYAYNLAETWKKDGHIVTVKIFGKFQKIPWGIRHIVFLFYIVPSVWKADCIFALDAFSAGVVTVVAKLFSKIIIFRTGGDTLWEFYVERTGDLVLLREFYKTRFSNLNFKEKILFHLMRWTLQNLSAVIWSTEWQKDIFMEPYKLNNQKHFIVENYYGQRMSSSLPVSKTFVGATRNLKWKNLSLLKNVFQDKRVVESDAKLDLNSLPHKDFLEKIKNSYAVIIVSLGDISPNTILDAIKLGKPFILTKETGLYDRIKDIAIFVNPQDIEDVKEKVIWLSDDENYKFQMKKIESFTFTHTWDDIGKEYIDVYKKIS